MVSAVSEDPDGGLSPRGERNDALWPAGPGPGGVCQPVSPAFPGARLLLKDLLGLAVSTRSLVRWTTSAATIVQPVEAQITKARRVVPVKHTDETGACDLGANGTQHWFPVTSTPTVTHAFFHRSRGREAVLAEGIMPGDGSISVHDGQKTSFPFEQARHALCHVHLFRELLSIHERTQPPWAHALIDGLHQGRRLAEEARASGLQQVPLEIRSVSVCLVRAGRRENPATAVGNTPTQGQATPSEASVLLHRVQQHREAMLLFLSDLRVPFDNHPAERDLRMITLQQKISGTVCREEGAVINAGVVPRLSFHMTHTRKERDLFDGIRQTISGSPFLPTFSEGLQRPS